MSKLQTFLDIRTSSNPGRAMEIISEGVSIRGYNLWLLFCAAALASIGLDTNSTAVIIGAMLISPLMSPILGVGLAIGIHDRSLLLRALRNLAAAIVLSLTASVLYFLVSPFGNATPEIEARIYPTLLDVLVALFGGIAGIVSVSRSGISNAVPGVAIATALMPPLCTAGYGLATQQWSYFGGAFYLFFINAVFISLATYLMAKYLRFPVNVIAAGKQRRYLSVIFTLLIVGATLPSIYFLYSVYQKEAVRRQIENIVFVPIHKQGNEILKWELIQRDSSTWINVYHSGKPLGDSLVTAINTGLMRNGLPDYRLRPHRVNLTREEINELSAEASRQMYRQLQLEELKVSDNQSADTLSYVQLDKETRVAFPFVDTLYSGWATVPRAAGGIDTLALVFYETRNTPPPRQRDQLYRYLKLRLDRDSIVLVNRPRAAATSSPKK
ncbi:MAG: DUF389 domain-containing protein [Sphingobacteriales bacterium]|nr:MAG: DUF389 domain-containing protein [Sphingobacteriales bacterium]